MSCYSTSADRNEKSIWNAYWRQLSSWSLGKTSPTSELQTSANILTWSHKLYREDKEPHRDCWRGTVSHKSLTNNIIKLACSTSDTYRAIIKHCKEQNIYYHTYQLKEDRAFRLVIKHLHHTTDLDDIKNELRILGHEVRNIINVTHRQTKEPLNIFFVDLEPAKNNKDIYEVMAIQNKIIHIEPPRSTKPHIPHCVRCQQYGHTRKYCNKPFNCVKCGGHHNSAPCTKPRDSPAKCALCGGPDPANYEGCEQYHYILKGYNPHRIASINRPLPLSQE